MTDEQQPERCPLCGRYKKDPESLTPRQRASWMRTGRYHGHGEASHAMQEASR